MVFNQGVNMTAINPVSNDAQAQIEAGIPYIVEAELTGSSAFLYHRWSVEAVAEKAAAAKGSKAKKFDDLESYVYRDSSGQLAIPGEYVRMSIVNAAKFKQDPRSPRKSAMDLYEAGILSLTELASVGKTSWDFIDQRRVQVQRAGITRCRPALLPGWKATFQIMVNTPEYISPATLHEVLSNAGRLVGVGDFRPTYGRFQVTSFQVQTG